MGIKITLENINKTYKEESLLKEKKFINALENINLEIPEGKTLAVIGPTGCGKTTLLKVIAGLINPDSGNIYFNQQKVNDLSPAERKIGMVFQNYALYPHYEARGNLAFPFWIKKTPEREIDEKIKETAEILGVDFQYLLNKKPKQLSGGEQQRVAIGRCIIRNPSVMLFDEPLSNLDARLRTITRVQIKKLLLRFQVTSVYVTHDQIEAISMGDLIAVMNEGKILQVGTYDELIEDPKNSFVASFVGKPPMNLIEAKIVNSHIIIGSKNILLKYDIRDGEYLIGFHAKDIKITSEGTFKGEIFFIDGTPSDTSRILNVETEEKKIIKILIKENMRFHVGEKISFSLPERIYVFDKISGKRVI
jgi:ABC-type sugar transport system ATPase subunit